MPFCTDSVDCPAEDNAHSRGCPKGLPGQHVKAKIEPRHDLRVLATVAFEMFTAYVDAGFTEAQALDLTYRMITDASKNSQEDEE